MTTLIFLDKENGEVGAAKNQLRHPSGSSKVLSERTQVITPLPKKAIKASPAISRSVRKALGDVNRTVGVTNKKEQMRQENQPYTAKKVAEKAAGLESQDVILEEPFPEIENMFCYDPGDFENFDLPEEDRINNTNLCGVPLNIFTSTAEKPLNMFLSPVEIEEVSWESNLLQSTADFISTLDEIIDMPPMKL
uniref:Securin n=1 Tax=Cairina moschata TaxID=8855 RepID=A0A8C3BL81_CAIMO